MAKYKQFKNRADDDEDFDFPPIPQKYLGFTERNIVLSQITVPIDEGVEGPEYYRHIVARMEDLTQNDEIKFRINSHGGRLDGLQALLYGIQKSDARSVAVIEGVAYSAASILALHCDVVEVAPYAQMMIHYISFGTAGKGSDIRDMVTHALAEADVLMHDTYEGFLTEDEIKEVINGREIYLNSEEITNRLATREVYFKLKEAQESEGTSEDKETSSIPDELIIEETKPKSNRKVKSVKS